MSRATTLERKLRENLGIEGKGGQDGKDRMAAGTGVGITKEGRTTASQEALRVFARWSNTPQDLIAWLWDSCPETE